MQNLSGEKPSQPGQPTGASDEQPNFPGGPRGFSRRPTGGPREWAMFPGELATDRQSPSRGEALVDLAILVLASLGIYGIELLLGSIDGVPKFEPAKGALTGIGIFVVALRLARRRGQTWSSIGLGRPARLRSIPLWGLVVMVATIAAQLTVVPLIAVLTHAPAPDLGRYDAIQGNLALFLLTTAGAMVTGGFMEEVVHRGWMIDRLQRIFGGGRRARWGAALSCGIPFGLLHFEWGLGGILATTVMGSVLGLMYLATKRNLWPLIAAHATLDFLLMLQVYLGLLES